MTDPTSLTRIRVGVRAVLTLAVVASIAANILHAHPDVIARAIAAWPPLALLLTVELISRVPVHRPSLAVSRLAATAAIAGIAAWVSYWHMVDVAHDHGETITSAHLIPLSVDGLVVVTSICLVEIGARIQAVGVTGLAASTPTGGHVVGETGTPTTAPTGTPDPTEASTPNLDPDPTEAEASGTATELVAASDRLLVRRLQRDISTGRLKANPGVEAIRTHLNVGTEKSRRLRDLLRATPAAGDRREDQEAAHA